MYILNFNETKIQVDNESSYKYIKDLIVNDTELYKKSIIFYLVCKNLGLVILDRYFGPDCASFIYLVNRYVGMNLGLDFFMRPSGVMYSNHLNCIVDFAKWNWTRTDLRYHLPFLSLEEEYIARFSGCSYSEMSKCIYHTEISARSWLIFSGLCHYYYDSYKNDIFGNNMTLYFQYSNMSKKIEEPAPQFANRVINDTESYIRTSKLLRYNSFL